jgi:hypothetical protein
LLRLCLCLCLCLRRWLLSDRVLGVCECDEGMVSGNGFGVPGTKGDCGAIDVLA